MPLISFIISAADAASWEMTLQNLICKYREIQWEIMHSHQRLCSKQGTDGFRQDSPQPRLTHTDAQRVSVL